MGIKGARTGRWLLRGWFLTGLLGAGLAAGANPVYLEDLFSELPPGVEAVPFFEETRAETITVGGSAALHTTSWHPTDHPKFDRYLRIAVAGAGENRWDVVLHSKANPAVIEEGDWVLVSLYARTGGATGSARFSGYIERNEPTWTSLGDVSGFTSPEWNRYVSVGQAKLDLAAGALKLSIHLALQEQVIDFAGIALLDLGPVADPDALPFSTIRYDGMAGDAPWRARAEAMIAQHRRGVLELAITDRAGQPLEGVHVEVEQVAHDYDFGTFFSHFVLEESAEAMRYRDWLKANFNYATTPVYWADWGWADAERREDYQQMAAWLQAEGIPARGHVLVYPGWQFAPAELKALSDDPDAFQARILEHLEEIVPIFEGCGVNEYDVTNELRQLEDFTDIVGLEGVVAWFHKVRELDPDAVLYLNENTILTDGGRNAAEEDHYFDLIETLLDRGAPLGGIGMQGHSTEALTPPARLWEILDRFAVFGLPIRITEYDLATRDQAGQARYDSDFMTAIFAHSATVGFTRWGFYEPVMWRPPGAIIDADGAYKPNGREHRRLLFETWHTRASGETGADGIFACDAYFGDYRVRVTVDQSRHATIVHFPKPAAAGLRPPTSIIVPSGREAN